MTRLPVRNRKEGDARRDADLSISRVNTLRSLGGAVLCCLALTACATDHTIRNSDGGYVLEYALQTAKLKASGEPVKILGRCASACTLYLALDNICIGRGAYFMFHAATKPGATAYMMNHYPEWVRRWIRDRGGLSRKLMTMRGDYAGKFLRRCG